MSDVRYFRYICCDKPSFSFGNDTVMYLDGPRPQVSRSHQTLGDLLAEEYLVECDASGNPLPVEPSEQAVEPPKHRYPRRWEKHRVRHAWEVASPGGLRAECVDLVSGERFPADFTPTTDKPFVEDIMPGDGWHEVFDHHEPEPQAEVKASEAVASMAEIENKIESFAVSMMKKSLAKARARFGCHADIEKLRNENSRLRAEVERLTAALEKSEKRRLEAGRKNAEMAKRVSEASIIVGEFRRLQRMVERHELAKPTS